MTTNLQERTILITGCSTGIGRCVAHGLRERGYRVFATARQSADVASLQSEGFESVLLDLDDSVSIQKAVASVLSRSGGNLYALFNNGAYGQPGAVEDLGRDVIRRQFETNVFGWLELTNLVIPVMRRQGYGRIIFNSSVLGFVAMPYRGCYNASKYAIEGLVDTLRLELAGTEIKISLIQPGPIKSAFRRNAYQAFKANIDMAPSAHRDNYVTMEARLRKEGAAVPFTLPPDAVLKRVVHALESKRPRIKYRVTFPTYLFSVLRRILPDRWLDQVLLKLSGDGRR